MPLPVVGTATAGSTDPATPAAAAVALDGLADTAKLGVTTPPERLSLQGLSPTQPAAGATPPSVARQVAPALLQLAHGPSGHTVTLRLDPGGLGHVQVHIDRDTSGAATVQVTAEHPETLRLLIADQPQLHRALDSAGLSADGRTLNFALADAGGNAFTDSGDGGAGGGQSNSRDARPRRWLARPDEEATTASPPSWLHAGVDITA